MKDYRYDNVYNRGMLTRVDYRTTDEEGTLCEKYAQVYLPCGYDEKKAYNILYVIHGGGGSADAWLDSCPIKNMLDYSIDKKEIEPLIVVFPCFYKRSIKMEGINGDYENGSTLEFQKELIEDLIPAVESRYHTCADHISEEALKASRLHRAISGFSMGGVTTWYCFMKNLPYFARFAPLSGDCWIIERLGGGTHSDETAERLAAVPASFGMGAEDFKIFAATGTKDIAYPQLTPMLEAMKKHTEIFSFSEDPEKGNLHYLEAEGRYHDYDAVCTYLYNILPYLFK